jgi:CRP/FNR family transcriptional regulator, nitrogen fixation regulation protein
MLTQSAASSVNPYISFARRQRPVQAPSRPGIVMNFARSAEIFADGEASGHVYKVLSGVVRISKLLPDGRRQISAFHLPGDMFGFEAEAQHHFTAETVVASKVAAYKWSSLLANSEASAEVLNTLLQGLRITQEHLLRVGRKNALERVAAFLIEMGERGGGGDVVELSMPRHDIADYLGLTLETVSRMLAELKAKAAIRLKSARTVELIDRELLEAMAA